MLISDWSSDVCSSDLSQVSAHYLIRSSDGQVTQMVREYNKAWHVRSHNPHSIGIEHEGYISNPDWYTSAMYNTSAAITRQSCARYAGIVCTRAMRSYTTADLSDEIGRASCRERVCQYG